MIQKNTASEDFDIEITALKKQVAFLKKIIDEVPANIYISDMEKGVVWCNKSNEETLGYSLDEILNMGGLNYVYEVIHPDDYTLPKDSISHYKKFSHEKYGGVFRARHKNEKTYKWFLGWARPFSKNKDGSIKEIIGVDVDMSHGMNTDEQLVAALKDNLKNKNKLLVKSLRKRELEVLGLVVKGLNTKAIAQKLFISEHTVKTHRKNIQVKLGTTNVAELVTLAVEAGL